MYGIAILLKCLLSSYGLSTIISHFYYLLSTVLYRVLKIRHRNGMTQLAGPKCLSERILRYIIPQLLLICNRTPYAHCFPDQGKWDFYMNHNIQSVTVPKSLFAGSEIYLQLTCGAPEPNTNISIQWMLIQSECWTESFSTFENIVPEHFNGTNNGYITQPITAACSNDGHIPLPECQQNTRSNDYSACDQPNNTGAREKRLSEHSQAEETHPIVVNRKINKINK